MKKMMILAMTAMCAFGAWAATLDGVQLWANGPYFATKNLGASSSTDYGYYYWWGDTVGYIWNGSQFNAVDGSSTKFSFGDYGTSSTTSISISALKTAGYIDDSGNLVAKYDAATVRLGAPWRIPTKDEWSALVNNCTIETVTESGVLGYKVTGKGAYIGNSIFLPETYVAISSSLLTYAALGYVWSSTAYDDSSSNEKSWHLGLYNGSFSAMNDGSRSFGCTIRPVYTATVIVTYEPGSYGSGGTYTDAGDGSLTLRGAIYTRSGYVQTGWSKNAAGTTKDYDLSASMTEKATLTLYPYWEADTPPSIGVVSAVQQLPWAGKIEVTVDAENLDATKTYGFKFKVLDVVNDGATTNEYEFTSDTRISGITSTNATITIDYAAGGGTPVLPATAFKNAKIEVTLVEGEEPEGCVQLWEDGPYFATCNVGATNPEDWGYFFWWGDTVGYTWTGSQFNAVDGSAYGFWFPMNNTTIKTYDMSYSSLQSNGYIDSTGNLAAKYDAATKYRGSPWRMPTKDEWQALLDNCTLEQATENDVSGYRVTGNGTYANKSIFLPSAGCGFNNSASTSYLIGLAPLYWSSTSESAENEAWYFSGSVVASNERCFGMPVRPVRAADGATSETVISTTTAELEVAMTVTAEYLGCYGEGDSATAYIEVTPSAAPTSCGNGTCAGATCSVVGAYNGSNYIVKVTGLTAGSSYTYTPVANGGKGAMASALVAFNATYTIAANECTREGYTFGGWATSAEGSAKYDAGQKVFNLGAADASVSLYAVWIEDSSKRPGDVQENIDADTEEKAKEAVTVALPEPTKFTEMGITGEKETAYRNMFEKKVTGEAGNYTVEIVLTKEAEEQVQTSVDEAVKKLADELSTKAFKTNHDRQFKLDIDDAVPGIYYSVESTATLDNPDWSASTSERVLCDGEGKFSVTLPFKGDPETTDSQHYRFNAHLQEK